MKIRIDNILLCILWLLAITLGTSFWFNTVFGFNIFSTNHWQYLAYLQAAHTPIKTGFYISMVVIVFIAIFGLYLVVRPRRRKIRLPITRISHDTEKKRPNPPSTQPAANTDASTLDIMPGTVQQPVPTPKHTAPSASMRPPRINLGSININNAKNTTIAQSPQSTAPQTTPSNNDINATLRMIFESAGYVIKPNPRINGIPISLVAIGTNENLWIGGVGIKTTDIRAAMDRFYQIFNDTLDEADININGFVIAAPDAAVSEFQDVLMFNTVSDLREYMRRYPNPPLPDDDDGMFDAYSQYIDAVINHIGKI